MKKLLLCATAAILSSGSAFAVTDGQTYAETNKIKCENLWIVDRNHNSAVYESLPIANVNARTACLGNGVIYVGNSAADEPEYVDEAGARLEVASLDTYSLEDGSPLGRIKLTLDGARYTGRLCANQVGVDSYGNLWVAPAVFSFTNGYKVYSVDPATGAMTLRAKLDMDKDARIDYCDLIGDITLAEAKCTIMAAGSGVSTVYRWAAEQGGNAESFGGNWDGIDNSVNFLDFYPEGQTIWGVAPSTKIVLGVDDTAYNADLFYIDGFTTVPTLYSSTQYISSSFAEAPELAPAAGCNGVAEFTLMGKSFVTYPMNQYDGPNGGCESNICELGPETTFAGMTKYWHVPANGMGLTTDGGTRIHSLCREIVTDSEGHEGVLLMTFKCFNGFGVYLIADKNYNGSGVENTVIGSNATITVSGNVITVSEEASEIAIFNLAGQTVAKVSNATEISAPVAGAYIVKAMVAGAPVVKKVVL